MSAKEGFPKLDALREGQSGCAAEHVRLAPEDRILLSDRATARGMPSATYVSVLVRSHLRNLAPLPKEELLALKRSVAELGAIGRNLNQIARAANQGGKPAGPGREDLKAMLQGGGGASRPREGAAKGQPDLLGAGTCRDDSLTSEAHSRFWTSRAMPVVGRVGAITCRKTRSS